MSDPKSGKDFDEALVSAKRAASVFERCGLVDEVLVGGQAVHLRLRDDGVLMVFLSFYYLCTQSLSFAGMQLYL